MSIIVKGIEMPTDNTVLLRIYPKGNDCAFYVEQLDIDDDVLDKYWAVPVPPHGRLIDADALIDKVIAKYLEHERKGELVFAAAEIKQGMVDLISDEPTIIPADDPRGERA